MNVLIIGGGGREHALAAKIVESPQCDKLFIAPGNPGTAKVGENVNLDSKDVPKIVEFCNFNKIKLVVVGPEQPLVDGLADELRDNHIAVFGPGKDGAQIEGDKAFSKQMMFGYKIPTADFVRFKRENHDAALEYLNMKEYPVVIKATGLAAGKGVLICENFEEAKKALSDIFVDSIFGVSGDAVVIEEFLKGEEASIFVITDGKDYQILPASQDHKRIGDNDTGKNTGGMGAYAPAPVMSSMALQCVDMEIIQPTMEALWDKEIDYRGCIYIGLMITKDGPKVIEYNCRFGDPETQVVLPLLEGDFLELLKSAAYGKLNKECCVYKTGTAICVVASAGGYPDAYEKGDEISGLETVEDDSIYVYHAGTKAENEKIVTNGGRVLGVTAIIKDNDIKLCKTKAYEAISKINFKGIHFRKDISDKAFNKTPFI
ncbi:MAG: phosphoribosylamine--glycine ligase [Bacteroidetes bacterium]|nr:phosphoribosylamine--glycine ligase [Bacteroidota bacterium]